MRLFETCQWWEMNHDGTNYIESIQLNPYLDKNVMWSLIMKECGSFYVSWEDSEYYHFLVEQFFIIHKFNIDKLVETMKLEYKPLNNFDWKQKRELDRGIHTADDTTRNDNTNQESSTGWNEKGRDYYTDTHLISAYNDEESPKQIGTDENGNPIYQYFDSEKYRDIHSGNYTKNGDSHLGNEVNLESETNRQIHTDEDVGENIHKYGNLGITYQSLITEERRVAEFNIYKWILKHFIHEMVIPIYY